MVLAMEKSLGIVSVAVKTVDIARATHYQWMQEDENYRKRIESIRDVSLDFAESKLLERIDQGDTTATIFFLKTQGRKRGYSEAVEFTAHLSQVIMPKPVE